MSLRRVRPQEAPVLVVGAGVHGLTFALQLQSLGREVVIAEGSRVVGGQSRSFHYDGFTFDFGLHAFVSSDKPLISFITSALDGKIDSFYPRAASRLDGRLIIEDTSKWSCPDTNRRFYDFWAQSPDTGWNCMAVSRPPKAYYPREGGFGRLFERMAEKFSARGGKIFFDAPINPAELKLRDGRFDSALIKGRRIQISGTYWTAGSRLLAPSERRRSADGLALYHFMVRGRPLLPYHWIRLYDVDHALLPRLVYYTAKFSSRNAPAGHHGLGAVVPLPAAHRLPVGLKSVIEWCRERPSDFTSLIQNHLAESGLLRDADVVDVRTEILAVPPPKEPRRRPNRYDGIPNFWNCDDLKQAEHGDSTVPRQMTAAMNSANEWAQQVR